MKDKEEKIHPLLKIRQIFSMGYLPSRKDQTYQIVSQNGKTYGRQMNCLAHACFNLTNELFDKLQFDDCDRYIFDAKRYPYEPEDHVVKNFIKKMQYCGLRVKKCKATTKTKTNEWKVALYFGSTAMLDKDYHFIIQESDGKWSSKVGWLSEVEYLKTPLKVYSTHGIDYKLYGIYIIENPACNHLKFQPIEDDENDI